MIGDLYRCGGVMSKLVGTQVFEQGIYSSGFGVVATLHRAIQCYVVRKVLLVLLIRHLLVLAHTATAPLIEMHHVS